MRFSTGRGMDRMRMEGRTMSLRGRLVLLCFLCAAQTQKTGAPRDPEIIDAQGYQKLIQQYRGKPLLITFWATWCEPCRDEYPKLNELAKQYAPKGLRVVGV